MRDLNKPFLCSLFLLLCSFLVMAQDDDVFEARKREIDSRFESVRKTNDNLFEDYRSKINQEFASYLDREWKKIYLTDGVPYPRKPKPKPKPVPDGVAAPLASNPLPSVIPDIETVPANPVKPIGDIPPSPVSIGEKILSVAFLGRDVFVRVPKKYHFTIPSCSSDELASAWNRLSGASYNNMLTDCISAKNDLKLCDWAYYQFIRALTEVLFGNDSCSEAVMTQMYIMAQSGYKIRLASQNGRLCPLVAFDGDLYSVSYFAIEGVKYYDFTRSTKTGPVSFCDFSFPGEQCCSIYVSELPRVPYSGVKDRKFTSSQLNSMSVSVMPNANLVRFYDSYPLCRWDVFAKASLSEEVKSQLYPVVKSAVAGMSEIEAVSVLLKFVQTAFDYKTDGEQFGREKPFFGDELFYYPFSDCEDRSILFSILVNDIVGLKVVLLNYPNHIATAVLFTDNVTGDYVIYGGRRYVICDPTYIGAPVGLSMPEMRKHTAEIILVN